MKGFDTIHHRADFAVVGGGLAGLCAAVSAARHGARVCLMQDRPMLGGNASGEVRMWVCGAQGRDVKETGLMEELELENMYRNPERNYSVWENVMYELARGEENLELILNCSCLDCRMEGRRIASVTGWQTTTQTYHAVEADIFADCSGDSVLAPLAGAPYRCGREGKDEFGESKAPDVGDKKTMGLSCLLQAREEQTPSEFIPPPRAYKYTARDLPYRLPDMSSPYENFWYLEIGGEGDSIRDTEEVRDDLIRMAYGIWDFVKNAPENREKNKYWHLDWVGMLPGKRESRRYVGAYTMTQNDVQAGGRFPDTVAYGGWSMDDHNPAGFRTPEPPTTYHFAPTNYGIPYRCLYSRDVDNLMFAGRNISVTHLAMSSTRVMATCATLGQAVGTAAALAVKAGAAPARVDARALQQALLWDDCFLPGIERERTGLTLAARLSPPQAEKARSGMDRDWMGERNAYDAPLNRPVEYTWEGQRRVAEARLVFDSDLNRDTQPEPARTLKRGMLANRPFHWPNARVSETLARDFRLEILEGGAWRLLRAVKDNHARLVRLPIGRAVSGVRFVPESTWGSEKCGLFAFDLTEECQAEWPGRESNSRE